MSLFREWRGLSCLGPSPGVDGVCARGTVDQLPVLLALDAPSVPSLSHSTTVSDDSSGPPTPEARTDPVCPSLDSAKVRSRPKPKMLSSRSSSQQPSQTAGVTRMHHPPASPQCVGAKPARDSRKAPVLSSDAYSLDRSLNTRPVMPSRSGSTRVSRSSAMASTQQRSSSTSSHRSSDTKSKASQAVVPRGKKRALTLSAKVPPPAPEIDDLSDCQLELRGPAASLRKGHNRKAASAPTSPNCTPQSPARSLTTSTDFPKDSSDDDSDASFCTAPLPSSRPALSRHGSEEAALTKRDGSIESKQALVKPSGEGSPSQRTTPSARSPSLRLLPCPRSVPVAGYQDWHSLSGLAHLNLCPLCTKQITSSRFRDRLVPALPRSRSQKTHCAFSEPWTRLAWIQTLQKGLDSLTMLDQITRPSPASTPCPGRVVDDQYWYRVVDPSTGMYLPNFSICSTCARNLKTLMPPLRDTFKRSASKQLRVCDLVPENPRFIHYIDLLDLAANRADAALTQAQVSASTAPPDITEFLTYARRKLPLRPCRRDRPILSTWHYMPELPELTVCEDCYDDVILPLARPHPTSISTSTSKHKHKHKQKPNPIAAAFHPTLRLLPGPDRAARCREASCQLYSAHMRAKFRKAVACGDLAYLAFVARRRVDAEREFRARVTELLLREEVLGVDVEEELAEVVGEWRRWE